MTLNSALGIVGIEECWINLGYSHIQSEYESLPVNWYYSSSDWARAWIGVVTGSDLTTNPTIRFRCPGSLGTNRTIYFVIEYTKTTD